MDRNFEEESFMGSHQGNFKVPLEWISKDVARAGEKVVVVSVFGHSPIDSKGYKTSLLELMIGRNVFDRNLIQSININESFHAEIDGYYDPENRVVYLHLNGAFDASSFAKSLENMSNTLQEKGFLVVWSEMKVQYCRALLLLFSISHIMLLYHPSHIFDMSYINIFQTLDTVRVKISSYISDVLKNIPGVSKEWFTAGRMCSPRVLFMFSSRLIPFHVLKEANEQNRYSAVSRLERNTNPIRKLELDLEYQIYRLLRKSRVITNVSYNSLFALPNNQPFVYVLEDYQESPNVKNLIQDSLKKLSSQKDKLVTDFNKLMMNDVSIGNNLYKASDYELDKLQKTTITCLSEHNSSAALSETLLATVATEKKRNLEHSFQLFLKQHIEEAFVKGFDDNVGRHSTSVLFEIPKANLWFETFSQLYNMFYTDMAEENPILECLKSHFNIDISFSNIRCAKILPLAISAYKDGLPSHYTQSHHQSKLEVAMGILASQARGPMYEKYVTQLEEACDAVWKDGRVGCEVLSYMGNTCQHPLHRLTKDEDGNLSVMEHQSGIVYINYCNCGHRKSQMEDPFTIRMANYEFYNKMEDLCCLHLEHFSFPTFKSSITDAKAATVESKPEDEWLTQNSIQNLKSHPASEEETSHSLNELSLGTAGLSQRMSENNAPQMIDDTADDSEIIVSVANDEFEEKETVSELSVHRQASTTEYLPGMLTTSSPHGLLPQFSSWSLVCLGPSSLYSHNAGISDQPGFLSGTNFLLPWDVTIKIRDKDKWPAIADSMGKKGFLLKNKKNRMGGDLSEFNVKIFLGTEYQCIRGHRFMMAAPDKHLKASHGHVKETAVKIANAIMPLYFPCACSRNGQVINGQLMRIHVVTPKAPVHVTLNPQIQPAPDAPIFIPQPDSAPAIKLSASAYWLLRLPYSYVGDNGPYYPPSRQPTSASYAKLLKGCYGISEITLDR